MAEHDRLRADAELEDALRGLDSRLAWPDTPPLAQRARAQIERAQRGELAATPTRWARRRRFAFWPHGWPEPAVRILAAALLLVLAIAAGALALSPAARNAVADRLGLRGVHLAPVATQPTLPPTAVSTPNGAGGAVGAGPTGTPALPGAGLQLGAPVTLTQARAAVRYAVLAPTAAALGEPDAIYLDQTVPGGAISFVYGPRPGLPASAQTGVGLVLTEFPGDIEPGFFGKTIGPDTRLTPTTVNGAPGWWLEGQPHLFYYRDATGRVRDSQLRLAGNTLLWEQGSLTVRIEAAVSLDEALRIATTVR